MAKQHQPATSDPRSHLEATNSTCSFCLVVLSMRDPSEKDLRRFRRHLQANHGLKMGEPES